MSLLQRSTHKNTTHTGFTLILKSLFLLLNGIQFMETSLNTSFQQKRKLQTEIILASRLLYQIFVLLVDIDVIKLQIPSTVHLTNSTALCLELCQRVIFKNRKETAALKSQNGIHQYPTSQQTVKINYTCIHIQ